MLLSRNCNKQFGIGLSTVFALTGLIKKWQKFSESERSGLWKLYDQIKRCDTAAAPMPAAFHVEDMICWDCEEEAIYLDLKEKPAVYKIGARCNDCDHDYGVLDRVSRSDVDHMDEVWEQAESAVQAYLE